MSMSMGLMEAKMLLPMSVGKASTHQHPSLLKIEDFDFIGKVCCFDLLSFDFMEETYLVCNMCWPPFDVHHMNFGSQLAQRPK
jgi:hypothetical protein